MKLFAVLLAFVVFAPAPPIVSGLTATWADASHARLAWQQNAAGELCFSKVVSGQWTFLGYQTFDVGANSVIIPGPGPHDGAYVPQEGDIYLVGLCGDNLSTQPRATLGPRPRLIYLAIIRR